MWLGSLAWLKSITWSKVYLWASAWGIVVCAHIHRALRMMGNWALGNRSRSDLFSSLVELVWNDPNLVFLKKRKLCRMNTNRYMIHMIMIHMISYDNSCILDFSLPSIEKQHIKLVRDTSCGQHGLQGGVQAYLKEWGSETLPIMRRP